MRRIAVFTEGLSEFLFTRHLIPLLFGYSKVSFECFHLHSQSFRHLPFRHTCPNPDAYFLIVDAGGGERVMSVIREREFELLRQGYDQIIGLRDMYSSEYCYYASAVDNGVIGKLIEVKNQVVAAMSDPTRIEVFFALMEFEAWLLGMYNLFQKVDYRLTSGYINSQLGLELRRISPEREFFHPSIQVGLILGLIGQAYTKSEHQINSIVSNINVDDLLEAEEDQRCPSLEEYVNKIESFRFPIVQ